MTQRLRALQLGLCKGQVFLADTHNIPMVAYQDGFERVLRRPGMVGLSEDLLNDSSVPIAARLRDMASLTEWFFDLKDAYQDPFGYYAFEKRWDFDFSKSIDAGTIRWLMKSQAAHTSCHSRTVGSPNGVLVMVLGASSGNENCGRSRSQNE